MDQLGLISHVKHYSSIFALSLILLGCGSGGNSGSSSCASTAIPEIQGLWIQQNSCGCSQFDQIGRPSTRCFLYIEGSKVVSGYLEVRYSECNNANYSSTLTSEDANTIRVAAAEYQLDEARIFPRGAAAAGTYFCRGSVAATLDGRRIRAKGLDYRYSGFAATIGRGIVCSTFWRDGPTLYLGRGAVGVPQNQNDEEVCDSERYTDLEPYFQPN